MILNVKHKHKNETAHQNASHPMPLAYVAFTLTTLLCVAAVSGHPVLRQWYETFAGMVWLFFWPIVALMGLQMLLWQHYRQRDHLRARATALSLLSVMVAFMASAIAVLSAPGA